MGKHDSCSCAQLHDHHEQPNLTKRWLVSLTFVVLSFIIMKPFIVKQLLSRASSYMTCELFNDAIRSYEKAVFIDKRNVMAWNMLGYGYKSNGELKKSLYAYRQVIKADPKDKSANFSIGVILASEKKYKEAVPYFEKVRALGPDNNSQAIDIASYHKSSLRLLVNCYDALKDSDKKNNALKELHKYYPEDSSISVQAKSGRLFR